MLPLVPANTTIWGICGGSGSGKSTLVGMLRALLPPDTVSVLHFDAYYRDLSHLQPSAREQANFDHPDSLEHELFVEHLDGLLAGRPARVPTYDFATHSRLEEVDVVPPAPLVIVEGILIFAFAALRERFAYSVFLDVPESVRLERRVARDVVARGRTEASVRAQFAATVAPMHDAFVQPWASSASRIVRYGADYEQVARQLADRFRSDKRELRTP